MAEQRVELSPALANHGVVDVALPLIELKVVFQVGAAVDRFGVAMRAGQRLPIGRELRFRWQQYLDGVCRAAEVSVRENNFAVFADENPERPGHNHSGEQKIRKAIARIAGR